MPCLSSGIVLGPLDDTCWKVESVSLLLQDHGLPSQLHPQWFPTPSGQYRLMLLRILSPCNFYGVSLVFLPSPLAGSYHESLAFFIPPSILKIWWFFRILTQPSSIFNLPPYSERIYLLRQFTVLWQCPSYLCSSLKVCDQSYLIT